MKRSTILSLLSLVLAAALLIGMIPTAMATISDDICDYWGHDWGSWKTTKSPTCTTQGTEERTCNRRGCGKKETRSIAAKGHSFKYLRTEKEATCTEDGIALFTCPQCSAKENRTVKAKGHDWDEGVITSAGLLEAGVKTFTCRNCGETKTEEIPVNSTMSGSSIMDLLRNGSDGKDDECDLHIVTQPEGGFISHDGGSMQLTVEAEGGAEPYTYVWRRRYNASAWAFICPWRTVKSSAENTCEADMGNYAYYCQVYDDEGHRVDSDKVAVNYELYIAVQPKNTNIYGKDSVTLVCKAGGGTPLKEDYYGDGYSYGWIGPDGMLLKNPVTNETGNELTVSEPGDYYAWVMDIASGEVYSAPATVYSVDPLRIPNICATQYLLEGEESTVWGAVYGGVQPYTVSWSRDGEELPTELTDDVFYSAKIVCDGSKEAFYTLTATDAMEAEVSVTVRVCYRQLVIAQQPEGGMLPYGGVHPLNLTMAEGEAPFTYSVYRNGEVIAEYENTSGQTSFNAIQSGEYYYHIRDAAGRWAESNPVFVEDYSFRVDHIDVSGELHAPGESVTLTAVTNGGEEPVTYEWWHFALSTNIATKLSEKEASISAGLPGTYRCYAKDANKAEGWNMAEVVYTGSAPIITRHPQKIFLKYEPNMEQYANELSVEAVAADGRTDCLSYEWEYKADAGWFKSGDKKSVLTAGYNPSIYSWRCVVTDTRNGEQTVSREGCISSEVYCTIISVTGDMKTDKKITVRYVVRGGTAPYTISVAASRVTGKTGGHEDRFNSLMGSDYILDNKEHEFTIHNYDPTFQYFAEYSGGSYNKKGSRPDIYITVKDSNNKTYSTDYYGQ